MHVLRMVGAIALLAWPPALWAQDAGPYAGQWVGTMKSQAGGEVKVDLMLQGAAGTWRMSTPDRPGRARANPCLERDLPVALVAQTAQEVQFDVQGAKVVKGCIDHRATLTTIDGKTLQGRLADGRALTFTRR